MSAFYLDVFQTISDRDIAPELGQMIPDRAVTMFTRLRVEADAPLSWIKAHADEIASQHLPGVDYCALNVEPLPLGSS